MLHFFKFPPLISKLIMSCISSSTISVLVNGSQTCFFSPSRGIHQGDPMSPYIFILCMELLSTYIHHQVDILKWDPISISPKGPYLSHLFFADDLTLMSKATAKSIHTMSACMKFFCNLSGQRINSLNSRAFYSKGCADDIRNLVYTTFGVRASPHFGKYLGFPILNHCPRPRDFQFIIDNILKRLSN